LSGTGEQVPTLPGTLHDMQLPEQAPLQQKPSTQKPEMHSLARVHAPTLSFLDVQVVPLQ
jgi:hypothetical protein